MSLFQNSSLRSDSLNRRTFAILVLLTVSVYALFASCGLSRLPLIDPDEPRYAGAGRTMAEGGSILIPEFNGEQRINKPPLFYWLVALSMKLTGDNAELGARLPSIASGFVMLLATIYFGRRVLGDRTAAIAGLVLSTMPLFAGLARTCITDTTLATFLTLALGSLWLGRCGQWKPSRAVGWAAFFLGLALMTKATPALSILCVILLDLAMESQPESRPKFARWWPLLLVFGVASSAISIRIIEMGLRPRSMETSANVFIVTGTIFHYLALLAMLSCLALAMLCARKNPSEFWKESRWPLFACMTLLMGLWWYCSLAWTLGADQLWMLFHVEISQRIAGAIHREGTYYYALILPAVCFPWSLSLPWLAAALRGRKDVLQTPARRFLIAWLVGIVFFFSIPGAKLATYVLSALPALALLIGDFLHQGFCVLPEQWRRRGAQAAWAMGAILLVVGAAALTVWGTKISFPGLAMTILALLATGIGLAGSLWARGFSLPSALCLYAAVVLVFSLGGETIIAILGKRSHRVEAASLAYKGPTPKRIYCKGLNEESLVFYLRSPVIDLDEKLKRPLAPALIKELRGSDPAWIIVGERYAKRIYGSEFEDVIQETGTISETLQDGTILLRLKQL